MLASLISFVFKLASIMGSDGTESAPLWLWGLIVFGYLAGMYLIFKSVSEITNNEVVSDYEDDDEIDNEYEELLNSRSNGDLRKRFY